MEEENAIDELINLCYTISIKYLKGNENMKFEWDEDKNTINKEKHKISFETAAYVFDDPYYSIMFLTHDSLIQSLAVLTRLATLYNSYHPEKLR